MAYANNKGIELWYEAVGDGDPVMLTGGWGIAHLQFERVTPLLADRFRVVNWNWRGIGRSDRTLTLPHSIELWTQDLEAVLDHAGIESTYLWGTSTGSLICMQLAARRPDRVKGVATWMLTKADFEFRRSCLVFPHVFEAFGYEGFAQLLSWVGLGTEKRLTQEGNEFARWEQAAFEDVLDPLSIDSICQAVANADVTPELGSIRCPMTVLSGTDGTLGTGGSWGSASLAELLGAVPHATVTPIAGASGTYCVLQRPRDCADAFTRWVDLLEGE